MNDLSIALLVSCAFYFGFCFSGKSVDEFLQIWRREAEHLLGAKMSDAPLEMFKVVAERKASLAVCA